MADTILTNAYNLQTPENGKFVKLDTASLTSEITTVDSNYDPAWPKYAVLTYIANANAVAKNIANPVFTPLGGSTLTFNTSATTFIGLSAVITKLLAGATGMYISYVQDITATNAYCWLNFSTGSMLTAGIDFNIGDTLKIEGSNCINALTVGVSSGIYIYADFYK